MAFWLACAAIAGFELWLAAPDEIVARAGPYDQVRYLAMAESIGEGRWLGDFEALTLVREPGYPIWLALVNATGIRLRIANELLMIAAAALMCAGLRRVGVSVGTSVFAFAILALQPHGELVLRELLPSSFVTAASWLALAGFLFGVSARGPRTRWAHFGWTALALGALWTARPERPLVVLWVFAFAVVDFTIAQRQLALRARVARSVAALAVFGAGIGICAGAIAAINHAHYGVWRTADPNAHGFAAINRSLVSIVQASPRRRVPVPEEVRRRAYAVSPTFRQLEPLLESPNWARNVSCRVDNVCDDIAAGYFRWILREAAASTVTDVSAIGIDDRLELIAREIDEACTRGALECQNVAWSFLHPYPSTWLSHLAGSFRDVVGRITSRGSMRDRSWQRDAADFDRSLSVRFDTLANRRVELTHTASDRIAVFVRSEDNDLITAHVIAGGRREPAALGEATERGHRIEIVIGQTPKDSIKRFPILELRRRSGEITRILLPAVGETAAADGIEVDTELWKHNRTIGEFQRKVRGALWTAHAALVRVMSVLGLAAAVALGLGLRNRVLAWNSAWGAIALIAVAVGSRIALLTVIDASSFAASSSRYVYPIASLYTCAMLLLVHLVWSRLAQPHHR